LKYEDPDLAKRLADPHVAVRVLSNDLEVETPVHCRSYALPNFLLDFIENYKLKYQNRK